MPGGTAQIVYNRWSALSVYTQRLTCGFAPVASTRLAPSVPAGAANLLLTAFMKLTSAQRTSVLAQTEIKSGYPLDTTRTTGGSWDRLNLAAARVVPGRTFSTGLDSRWNSSLSGAGASFTLAGVSPWSPVMQTASARTERPAGSS